MLLLQVLKFCKSRSWVMMASLPHENWHWNTEDCSRFVKLGCDFKSASFHPMPHFSMSGVRGTQVLNNGRYFWELRVSKSMFVNGVMFGIATRNLPLQISYPAHITQNQGWLLSHNGNLWHAQGFTHYTQSFCHNEVTSIGVLFDGISGRLSYYINGRYLGVAFEGLNDVKEDLYPVVFSSSGNTVIALTKMSKEFVNLQDRCRAVILKRIKVKAQIEILHLPTPIKEYLMEPLDDVEI
jgi:SOCS box./SPRY domain.